MIFKMSYKLNTVAIGLFLVAAMLITLLPIYMTILNSLKTDGEILNNILAYPTDFKFSNYTNTFQKINFLPSLANTAKVTILGLGGIVLFASMAGYKLSRTAGRLSTILFMIFILSMLIPFHSIMISLTRISRGIGMQGTLSGLGMIYIGLGVSMAVFLYHGFVKSIPRALDEAALMDGCGELRLFFSIIFPLLVPISATVAILNVLWMWNDFLLPLIMITDSSNYTLLLSTNMLFGEYGNNEWSSILSALVMTMIPVMLFYLILQKYILKGIADGAVKG